MTLIALTGSACSKARDATGTCIAAAAPNVHVKVVDCGQPHTGVVVESVDHASDCPAGTWHYTSKLMKTQCVRDMQSTTVTTG